MINQSSSSLQGEKTPIGKDESIFSFISLKNKERLDSFISKASKPTKIEVAAAPLPVYTVPTKVAQAALKGFMPFADNLEKQSRYKSFLEKIVQDSNQDNNNVDVEKPKLSDADRKSVV